MMVLQLIFKQSNLNALDKEFYSSRIAQQEEYILEFRKL